MLKDELNMNEIQKETDNLLAEISRQNELLESRMDQPSKLFAASVLVKPELKNIHIQLDRLRSRNVLTRYVFKRDDLIERTINEEAKIGLLQELSDTEAEEIRSTENATDLVANTRLLKPRFCRNINIDGNILSYEAKESNGYGVCVNNHRRQFNIEILALGRSDSIAIGMVSKDVQYPGTEVGTYGYHSNGNYFENGDGRKVGQAWKKGDYLSCYIMEKTVPEMLMESGKREVVYEHNGKVVRSILKYSQVTQFVQVKRSRVVDKCHFAIGLKAAGDKVKVTTDDLRCSIQ